MDVATQRYLIARLPTAILEAERSLLNHQQDAANHLCGLFYRLQTLLDGAPYLLGDCCARPEILSGVTTGTTSMVLTTGVGEQIFTCRVHYDVGVSPCLWMDWQDVPEFVPARATFDQITRALGESQSP